MKKDIHPDNYRPVVFQDKSGDFAFLTRSTVRSTETIQWEDGNEYPLVNVEISSASHPFYTGKQKFVDSAGRVEKFGTKYNWGDSAKEKIEQAAKGRKRRKKKEKVTVGLPSFKKAPEEAPKPERSDKKDAGAKAEGGGSSPDAKPAPAKKDE